MGQLPFSKTGSITTPTSEIPYDLPTQGDEKDRDKKDQDGQGPRFGVFSGQLTEA